MSSHIRCGKGHNQFEVALIEIEAEDGDGNKAGYTMVHLRCPECGEEDVLELAHPYALRQGSGQALRQVRKGRR